MTVHPNSKKIKIQRLENFLASAQGKDTAGFFGESKQGIGSYFASINSKEIGSGLTNLEKNLLLPYLVDIPADDRDFRKVVTEFYVEIDTKVPFKDGVDLEIGLEVSNDKPVSKDNLPINIMDFIRYRHAITHPRVALSKDEGSGNMLKSFYIFDKDSVSSKNTKKNVQKDVAMAIFLKVKENPDMVDQMLTLLGVNIREKEFTGKDGADARTEKLRELAVTKDEKMIELHKEEHLEIKFWIQRMVNARTILHKGGKYIDGETLQTIANSLDEMVAYFLDIENSGIVNVYKARLQEAESIPMEAAKRKTLV